MDRLLQIAKIAALLACVFLAIALGMASLEVRKAAIGLEADTVALNGLIVKADSQVSTLGSETHRLLLETGLTAMEARKAAVTQRKFWDLEVPRLAARAEGTFDRTDALLTSITHTSDGLSRNGDAITASIVDTSNSIKPVLLETNRTLTATTDLVTQASLQVSDPDIHQTLNNIAESSHQMALASASGAHILDTLDQKATQIAHPGKLGVTKSYGLYFAQLAYYLRFLL